MDYDIAAGYVKASASSSGRTYKIAVAYEPDEIVLLRNHRCNQALGKSSPTDMTQKDMCACTVGVLQSAAASATLSATHGKIRVPVQVGTHLCPLSRWQSWPHAFWQRVLIT